MDKLYYDKYDIMNMFHCGVDKAMAILRSIKSVSNIADMKGKVTITDYQAWLNRPIATIKKDNTVNAVERPVLSK